MKKIISFALLLFIAFYGHAQLGDAVKSVKNNERFVATTSNIGTTIAVAGTLHHVITFSNNSGSGYELFIDKILFFASGTNAMVPTSSAIVVNPTLVTANATTPSNLFIGSAISDATTSVGYNFSTTALTGTQLPFELPATNGANILTIPFGLKPGNSFGIDLYKTVAIGAINSGYFMIYYIKLPI